MKQELRKLKGSSITTSIGEIVLKDFLRAEYSEYDQMYFTTNQDFLLCKVYLLDSDSSVQRFEREKEIYSSDSLSNMARCIAKNSFYVKKNEFGVIVLDEIQKHCSLRELTSSLSSFQLLKFVQASINLIAELKTRGEVFLNMKPQNIYIDANQKFCFINPEYICQKGKHSKIEEENQFLLANIEKEFKYCSPELLDNYSYFEVDEKADIFALGCVLYETVFGRYPFQSKFANINIIYDVQEGFFGNLIDKIFKPYKERCSLSDLSKIVEEELKKNPEEPKQTNTSSTNQSKNSNTNSNKNAPSFFEDLTSVFTKYTKESEGAYLSFADDSENIPNSKHLNFILNKLYKNPGKVDKLQSIITKHTKQAQPETRKIFILKTMVFILLILRKTRNHLLERWVQVVQEIVSGSQNIEQIADLGNILLKKLALQIQLNCILRGNFSLEDMCQFKLLTIENIANMLKYLDSLLTYAGKLMTLRDRYVFQYILEIICNQIYDLVSMAIFSIICIRKDNELKLRSDNLRDLEPCDKKLGVILKRINNISNCISHHAIYSIETDYYNYREDIYVNEELHYTSFEYMAKYYRNFKGLSMPESLLQLGSSNYGQTVNNADYGSMDASDNVEQNAKKKKVKSAFGEELSSEDEDGDLAVSPMQNSQHSPSLQVPFYVESSIRKQAVKDVPSKDQILLETKKAEKSHVNNLFGNSLFDMENIKRVKSNDVKQPLSAANKIKADNNSPKMGFEDFSHFLGGSTKQPSKETKKSEMPKKVNQNKTVDPFTDFNFMQPPKPPQKKAKPKDQPQASSTVQVMNLLNINDSPPTKQQKIQNLNLNDDIFSYEWLKKAEKSSTGGLIPLSKVEAPPAQEQPSPFVQEIIAGLKLKQLKELILKNRDVVIQFNKLVFDKVIGSGSAGEVYLGKYKSQMVAIKKVKTKENPNALKEFQRQLVTYIKIKKNEFLVSLIGLSKSGEDFYLLTEFCTAGSLFDLLHKKAGQIYLSWKVKMSLILQCAQGMKALHDMRPPIIHRDLKSLNVFISQKENKWIAKVADFGLSRSPQAEMMTMALGTLHWMAPQLLDGKQYSLKVDVYSFAVCMWEICARRTPYYELPNPMAIMKYVTIDKKRPNMSIIDNNCPPKLIELINRCWDQDPANRPLFAEILEILTKIDSEIPAD